MAANGHGFASMARSYRITTALSPQPALDLMTELTGLCIGPILILAARKKDVPCHSHTLRLALDCRSGPWPRMAIASRAWPAPTAS